MNKITMFSGNTIEVPIFLTVHEMTKILSDLDVRGEIKCRDEDGNRWNIGGPLGLGESFFITMSEAPRCGMYLTAVYDILKMAAQSMSSEHVLFIDHATIYKAASVDTITNMGKLVHTIRLCKHDKL